LLNLLSNVPKALAQPNPGQEISENQAFYYVSGGESNTMGVGNSPYFLLGESFETLGEMPQWITAKTLGG